MIRVTGGITIRRGKPVLRKLLTAAKREGVGMPFNAPNLRSSKNQDVPLYPRPRKERSG